MSVKIKSRSAQWPLAAEFTFAIGDTMLNTSGVSDNFAVVGTHVFDVIPLPPGATVVSGHVVGTAITGPTAFNVSVGDSGSAARYLGITDKVTAALTPLVPTGYAGVGENLRITISPTVADATAGTVTVRIVYTVAGRTSEVQIT